MFPECDLNNIRFMSFLTCIMYQLIQVRPSLWGREVGYSEVMPKDTLRKKSICEPSPILFN